MAIEVTTYIADAEFCIMVDVEITNPREQEYSVTVLSLHPITYTPAVGTYGKSGFIAGSNVRGERVNIPAWMMPILRECAYGSDEVREEVAELLEACRKPDPDYALEDRRSRKMEWF